MPSPPPLSRRMTAMTGTQGDHLHETQRRPLRSSASCILLREVDVPKKQKKPRTASSAFLGLDMKLVDLCRSNDALRRRVAHLFMTHGEYADSDAGDDDDLELVPGRATVVKRSNENEILALLHKQNAQGLGASGTALHPSIQRAKSDVALPIAIDDDVAKAVQHDMIMTVPSVAWTAKFEDAYMRFKRGRPKAKLNSVQVFRSYLMTPEFRALHAMTYGATRFHEDTTGTFANDETDHPLHHGLQKRLSKLTPPMRSSLELSLSNHMLENFDHLLDMYTSARRDFLAQMTQCGKRQRHAARQLKEAKQRLESRRADVKKDVAKTRAMLGHRVIAARLHTPRDPAHIEGSDKHAVTMIVSASKRAAAKSWKKIKEAEKCNVARSLQLSIEYAKTTTIEGGGLPTRALCLKQQRALTHHIVYIQRLYRGHMARRYVYSLKWLFFMWRHLFFPSTVLPKDSVYGFMHIDDFEASFEYFYYQSNAERVYMAGFALTVPPSRLGGQFVEYHRFKRYWLRFMYRASGPADMVRFVQFVRNREAIIHSIEIQRQEHSEARTSTLSYLTQIDDFKKLNYTKRRDDHAHLKYRTDLAVQTDEHRSLTLRARRALLPSYQQRAKGWALLRHIVTGNAARSFKVHSFRGVVVQVAEVEGLTQHKNMLLDLPAPAESLSPVRRVARRRASVVSSVFDVDPAVLDAALGSRHPGPSNRFERHLKRLGILANDAVVLCGYYTAVGLNDIGDDAPPPLCVSRLGRMKHLHGCTSIPDLLTKQGERHAGFAHLFTAFEAACAADVPENVAVLASLKSYLNDSMELLTFVRQQLAALRPPKPVVGAAMIALQRTKRIECYNKLLEQLDTNVRAVLDSMDRTNANDDDEDDSITA
ncbi:hypothetical protein SDRG_00143 [Saprolegnia diclina VS20]|uniref:Uncharacterized protein n=1 Tax=Saprolegnia diclina (strain VS20) TaxID=1156394 RepID=T0SHD2_SAPDV|nr:hypothetical protein SDRG_00143 [Saprolegnia diclina VS20]EQC42407.1 hypothetical protein SDRG_00143 [Saprolegnia diclina VS20]|eukprot:XP_008603830.1 hypothetical protein SDRG_00143 [Saprolegnia diclina VS20]